MTWVPPFFTSVPSTVTVSAIVSSVVASLQVTPEINDLALDLHRVAFGFCKCDNDSKQQQCGHCECCTNDSDLHLIPFISLRAIPKKVFNYFVCVASAALSAFAKSSALPLPQ